ncbi:FAD:protein FMN transferase [Methyloparacoccus murrellii]
MAEVGGEMRVRGSKADGTPWRVAIEKPTPMAREVQRILELHEASSETRPDLPAPSAPQAPPRNGCSCFPSAAHPRHR